MGIETESITDKAAWHLRPDQAETMGETDTEKGSVG